MRVHDQYRGIKEQGVIAILQEPGKEPVQVLLDEGYTPQGVPDQDQDTNSTESEE